MTKHVVRMVLLLALLLLTPWQLMVGQARSIDKQMTLAKPLAGATSCPSSAMIKIPLDCTDLQDAILKVAAGGIVELAGGTYPSPTGGFHINNLQKALTIRAASGANVVLSGQNSHEIVQYMNSDISLGRLVTFEGLTFANGYSAQEGLAGAVTIMKAQAAFTDCSFLNNVGNQPTTGGGAVVVALGSTVNFVNTTWNGNTDQNEGGAMNIAANSQVSVTNSQFTNNRTNLPNHRNTSAGGAIHVVDSSLTIDSSHFQNNQAGYAGGAVYALGTWSDPVAIPHSSVSIANSFFTGNMSLRDPSVSLPAPTEGGALLFEDQTTATIQNTQFNANSANVGGAISQYRSIAEISSSYFIGNRATGAGVANGFGGAISATSNDTSLDGNVNRRSVSLTIRDSLIWGGGVVGQAAGGVYASGDGNRTYGINGASQMNDAATNRANVSMTNVVFFDTDVQEVSGVPGTGVGGAIIVDLANLTMQSSAILRADAFGGGNSSGGAIAVLNQSSANIADTTIALNTAGVYGAGIFAQGSYLYVNRSNLVENEISPGISEPPLNSYGAAIFVAPDVGRQLDATGAVENSTISNNIGVPIFDDDRTNGPINSMRYNNNVIYMQAPSNPAYTDSIAYYCCKPVDQLNSLTVSRANSTSTRKSISPNSMPSTMPVVGALWAVPATLPGSGPTPPMYLAFAWSGMNSAIIDGVSFTDKAGVAQVYRAGTHTMVLGSTTYSVTVPDVIRKMFLPLVSR